MRSSFRVRSTWIIAVLSGVAIGVYLLWPASIRVTSQRVELGPMRVTIDEDGRTRVKQRYVVSAPLDGRLQRTALRPGDSVTAGATVVASIIPKLPEMLDARTLEEASAKVRVAESAADQAARQVAEAREAHELAQHQFERARKLVTTKAITVEAFEAVEHHERMAVEALRAAEFHERMTRYEIDLARAALKYASPARNDEGTESLPTAFEIRAPISGRVFRVIQESEAMVRSGASLVELGDVSDLEIEVDLLSSDAVRVKPGAKMLLENWGGPQPLLARVRLVEPSGFTKVSALGVEEQRVFVIGDFIDPPAARPPLGDGFRVEARVVEWESDSVLSAPAGAVFRHGDGWAVYLIRSRRACLTPITIGRHNGRQVEVLSGLAPGDEVITHPDDRIQDQVRISP